MVIGERVLSITKNLGERLLKRAKALPHNLTTSNRCKQCGKK